MGFLELDVYNRIPLILDKQARVSSTEAINFSNKFSADTENKPAAKSNIIQTPCRGQCLSRLGQMDFPYR
jgi:hypothetical protein